VLTCGCRLCWGFRLIIHDKRTCNRWYRFIGHKFCHVIELHPKSHVSLIMDKFLDKKSLIIFISSMKTWSFIHWKCMNGIACIFVHTIWMKWNCECTIFHLKMLWNFICKSYEWKSMHQNSCGQHSINQYSFMVKSRWILMDETFHGQHKTLSDVPWMKFISIWTNMKFHWIVSFIN